MIDVMLPNSSQRTADARWSSRSRQDHAIVDRRCDDGGGPERGGRGPERGGAVREALAPAVSSRSISTITARRRHVGRARQDQVDASSPTTSASRSAMRRRRSASTAATRPRRPACTQAIDEPGRMSWNCWVSTSLPQLVHVGDRPGSPPRAPPPEQPLTAPVPQLGLRLAGQRAAVGLEVDSPRHTGPAHRGRRLARCVEERRRRVDSSVAARRCRARRRTVRASRGSAHPHRRRDRTASASRCSTRDPGSA